MPKPETTDTVLDAVSTALADGRNLEVLGGGGKRGWGRPLECSDILDLSAVRGVTLYEPDELVLSARAGTPMAEIVSALDENRQLLAFEPGDYGPLWGGPVGAGTIGGILACNLSGPRRILAGAARDHFLGFEAVSGRGEAFKGGGRVVKNVTGFDLAKLLAGSFGTLAVLTSVTLKVLPAPEKIRTVVVYDLAPDQALAALRRAQRGPFEVSGAAHVPAAAASSSHVSYVGKAGASVTAVRVEGPGPSVEARTRDLRRLFGDSGETEELHSWNSRSFWREMRDVAPFVEDPKRQLWRLSVPPADGALVAAAILDELTGDAFFDWGGGLIWLAISPLQDAGAETVRAAVGRVGGHATLIRAADAVRAQVPVFQPQSPVNAALEVRIKENFDPRAVLNPGRLSGGV